jgi:hypothetical protein
VIDLDDIASMNPRNPVLYKFHGDFGRPDSIVFCEEDYETRGPASDHPLDIRLRSDALARTFVFVGYSFRDPNIRALFANLQRLFGGKLPPSFLIQYTPDATFASELERNFSVRVINCRETNPTASTDAEAFAGFMRDLCRDVIRKKTGAALEERFKPRVPASSWVATRFEVDGVGQAVVDLGVDEGIKAFRGAYDQAVIPSGFEEAVAAQFVDVCKKAVDERHAVELKATLFNLRFSDPGPALQALTACCAISNNLPSRGAGMETFMPHSHALPDDGVVRVIAIANAFLLLREWGRSPSKRFYEWIAFMLHSPPSRAQIPAEVLSHAR